MHAASWHSKWVSMGRTYFRWNLIARTTSQSVRFNRSRHGSSHLQRNALSLAHDSLLRVGRDGGDLTENSRSLYALGSSPQSLLKLVKEEKYDEADEVLAELLELGVPLQPNPVFEHSIKHVLQRPHPEQQLGALADWLTLLPDLRDTTPDAFHDMLRLLAESPHMKLPLITQFGIVCAGKGYMSLVEAEVIPLVARIADPASLASFTGNIYVAARQYRAASRTQHPSVEEGPQSLVFEDLSDDYKTVMSEAKILVPSPLQLMEETLPARLPEPSPNDSSLFENESDFDYISDLSASRSAPNSSTDALVRLVTERQYGEANHLLIELQELHSHIPPALIYEKAAINAVLHPSKGSTIQEQVNQFSTWFSLIPPRYISPSPNNFSEISRLCFRSPVTNLHFTIRFGIILASKGYADIISSRIIPLIMRFCSSEVSTQFLKEFEQANVDYQNTDFPLSRNSADASYVIRKAKTDFRGLAVRTYARSGHFDYAMALLPDREAGFGLTEYTYDILVTAIRHSKNPTYLQQIPHIISLQEDPLTCIRSNKEKETSATIQKAEDAATSSELRTAQAFDFGDDLVRSLRYLKSAVASPESLPSPLTIVDFIHAYRKTGRTRAPTMLLKKAFQTSHVSSAIFLFSEMLYYRQMGHYDLVIETFVDHFYLTAVPRGDVLDRYHRYRYLRQNPKDSVEEEMLPHRFHVGRHPSHPRGKIWPLPAHCGLVWQSLATLAPSDDALDRLYRKLLQVAEGGTSQSISEIPALLPPPSWKTGAHTSAFTGFMRRLMQGFGANKGAQLLGDMMKVGLTPTVFHFTELAGYYARTGDSPRAFMILNRMEAQLKRLPPEPSQSESTSLPSSVAMSEEASSIDAVGPGKPEMPTTSSESSPSAHAKLALPVPDVVMYTCIIRGFLIAQKVEEAKQVLHRLEKVHTRIPGENPYLDGVYQDLGALKKNVGANSVQMPTRQ